MFLLLARYWGITILRGMLYILLGFVAFTFPTMSLSALIALLSTFLLTDGFLVIWMAAHQRDTAGWQTLLLEGVMGIIFGWLMLLYPFPSVDIVLTILAGWAVMTGITKAWSALHMSQDAEDEFWLGLGGVFGVAFGVLILLFPIATHGIAMMSVGAYSLIAGTILSILGMSLRQHLKELKHRLTQLSL
jgi:uncharacterized membrane protein HdeD (DUF308 family)